MTSLDMYFKHVDTALIDSEALPWVPFEPYTPDAHVKLLKADPVRGEIIALLKVPASMELPRHHHTGTFIFYTLPAAWPYKAPTCIATPGTPVSQTTSTPHPHPTPTDQG